MLGKKVGAVKATATTTVLPVEGSNPKFETSIGETERSCELM